MLTVQIGQCGNQLGAALFQQLAQETKDEDEELLGSFFRASSCEERKSNPQRVARAVLIDMEPKVVAQCTANHGSSMWGYDPRNTFTKQNGSGNNWSLGYTYHRGTQTEYELLELVRFEAERCDLMSGFHVLQSVAGGTGSGLGSFLTEMLADEYPNLSQLNTVVWPYASGEVIVQNYNAVLTMARLTEVSHGIIVLQNDVANIMCKDMLGIQHPSLDALNNVLSTQLASIFLPLDDTTMGTSAPMHTIVPHLCHHPGFKLLDLKTVPQMPHKSKAFSTHTWTGILKHLYQMQITNSSLEQGIDWGFNTDADQYQKSLASLLILRGKDAMIADSAAFTNPRLYAGWSRHPFRLRFSRRAFNAYDKTATLVSNSKTLLPIIESVVDKAHQMYAHRAFLHQYEQHGVEHDFFQEAFLRVDQVVQNYRSI